MKNNALFLSLSIICSTIDGNNGLRSFSVDFVSYRHETNPKYFALFDLKLLPFKGHQALNGTMIFNQDIREFFLDLLVIVPKANGKKWTFLNITSNGCDFAEGRNKAFILPSIVLKRKTIPNDFFPEKCPFLKNTTITVPMFYLDAEFFPTYMPEMKFNATFIFRQKTDYVYKMYIGGTVERLYNKRKITRNG